MNKIKWAEKKAYKLLDSLNISELPIPVEKIAMQLNITISYEPFDGNMSGLLYRDETHTIIGVNSEESKQRQRFTIAHELGHFILHEGDQIHVDHDFRVNFRDLNSSLAINTNEIEANAFAAALLMPENIVKDTFDNIVSDGVDSFSDNSEEEIAQLARMFNVSQKALLIRLGKLGLLV
jgi:Zn-dependent peptidase ImmA (M78 family)